MDALEKHFGRSLDKFERLTADSLFSVAILMNAAGDDFQLVDRGPVPPHVAEDYRQRGLGFAGVVGVSQTFAPRVALAVPLKDDAIAAITQAFVHLMHVEEHSTGVDWLRKLWALPDKRMN